MLIGGLSSPASEVRYSSVAITLTARYLDSPIETGFKYRLFSFTNRMISAVQGEDSLYPIKHVRSRDGFLKS